MRNPNRTTAQGTRQFFEWLEKWFGGKLPMDSGAEILTSHKTLELTHLQRLVHHDGALAIHVKEFYPRQSAIELAKELAKEQEKYAQNWKVSTPHGKLEPSDVLTLGTTPYNMAVANGPEGIEEYYQQVAHDFRKRRRHEEERDESARRLWPLDKVRLELDEVWSNGAGLARHPDFPALCKSGGLTRVTRGPTRWKKGFIHVDEMAPLDPNSGYYSANVYLQLPDQAKGNHEKKPILEIWPLAIKSKWEWYKNANTLSHLASQDAEGQILLRKALGEPERIYAEPGDLILLCVQRPHAAIGFQTNDALRISLQCFIQYSGDDNRLLIEA